MTVVVTDVIVTVVVVIGYVRHLSCDSDSDGVVSDEEGYGIGTAAADADEGTLMAGVMVTESMSEGDCEDSCGINSQLQGQQCDGDSDSVDVNSDSVDVGGRESDGGKDVDGNESY